MSFVVPQYVLRKNRWRHSHSHPCTQGEKVRLREKVRRTTMYIAGQALETMKVALVNTAIRWARVWLLGVCFAKMTPNPGSETPAEGP